MITASRGRIGLGLLESHPVDLVILDYRMPEMDGEAVTREIRRTRPDVRTFMLSGQIDVPPFNHLPDSPRHPIPILGRNLNPQNAFCDLITR